MDELARQLTYHANRPVLNDTGLSGKYDFEYPLNPSDPGDSTLAGVQESLNLKLAARKGPIEVLVVDHVERPSGN